MEPDQQSLKATGCKLHVWLLMVHIKSKEIIIPDQQRDQSPLSLPDVVQGLIGLMFRDPADEQSILLYLYEEKNNVRI